VTVRTVPALSALDYGHCVAELHNTKMPHAAFDGQTPDEIYFGRGDDVPDQLATARRLARQARLEANRVVSCEDCRTPVTETTGSQLIPPETQEAV